MSTCRLRLVALLVAGAALAAPVLAQNPARGDPAKTATIHRLLDLLNAATLMEQGMEAMLPAQRAASPQIPAAFWDAFVARARRDLPQLVDSLIPIYAARFTQAELDELVRFYSSPLGKHLAQAQPEMMQESVGVGQRWGAAIGREIADSLRRSGAIGPQ